MGLINMIYVPKSKFDTEYQETIIKSLLAFSANYDILNLYSKMF
jgi:hypothetical protein